MSTLGTWIYEKGSATGGGGGGADIQEAPPVHIDGASVQELADHSFQIDIDWHKDATATAENFRGAAVYLEDPDISSGTQAPMDDSQPLDSTAQVSGTWQPKRMDDSFKSPASIKLAGQDKDRDVRVYLAAFAKAANVKLVRANDPVNTPTPNIVVHIPQRSADYVSGQEYAWNVTGAQVTQVDDFENEAGPQYYLIFNYTAPDPSIPLPPGMSQFAGVRIVYEYDDGTRAQAIFLDVDHPDTWISDRYQAVGTGHFKCWFVSADVNGNVNTIVPGVTPVVDVTVVYPPEGEASAPDITGLRLSNYHHETQPDYTIFALADLDWQNPDSPRYAMTTFYRVNPLPVRQLAYAPSPVKHVQLQIIDWPTTVTTWTIAAIASDYNGKPAADPNTIPLPAHIPTVPWSIGPPGAAGSPELISPLITVTPGVTKVDFEQQLNSDGVVMMRFKITGWVNPTGNNYGGASIARTLHGDPTNPVWWDAGKTDTSLTTDWEPAVSATDFDFWFVSRDGQGKRNAILMGFTPSILVQFRPQAGNVLASRMPKDWFDTTEFQWPDGGDFSAKLISAGKISVGSILRVGGGFGSNAASFGGAQNGQIAVFNSANVLRAWIGEQDNAGTPDNPGPHSIWGGWFGELYVGGDNPTNAPIYATNAGSVIIGGFAASGARYPNISIRKDTGAEVGRIGAKLTSGITSGVPDIHGIWMQEAAFGGITTSDWKVLIQSDPLAPGSSSVQIRDVKLFSIDYPQNYNPGGIFGTNPTNAANHMEFGANTFVADAANSQYYKFPGFSIKRTGTSHAANFINRGIVLWGPNNNKLGAFVSFNGDQFGSDSGTFWGSLTMLSPVAGILNVNLASGASGSDSATFYLLDDQQNQLFSVAKSVAVICRWGVSVAGGLAIDNNNNHHAGAYMTAATGSNIVILDAGGNYVGPGINMVAAGANTITTNGDVHARSYYVGGTQVISQAGAFIGTISPSSLAVTGAISAGGSVTAGSLTVSGQATINSDLFIKSGAQTNVQLGAAGGIYARAAVQADGGFLAPGGTSGKSGSFQTADGKTITVSGGIITGGLP